MKYIGPFLKLNSLNKENIKNQLFFLSKESIKLIVLNSGIGITIPAKQLKNKLFSNIDIITYNSNSPLLCIYKKGDSKLETTEKKLKWSSNKTKKEIVISSNAYMTLNLLELSTYYRNLEHMHPHLFNYSSIYCLLAKKQLEFYALHLRNFDGLFIDKVNLSDPLSSELNLEEKSSNFKFSDQALMMVAFYNFSQISTDKEVDTYKNFSLDIFNMLKDYKENLYDISLNEITKISLALNIFYLYNNDPNVLSLLLDINDFAISKESECNTSKTDFSQFCMLCLNSMLLYKITNLLNYKDTVEDYMSRLKELYCEDMGIMRKNTDKKEISYSSTEILLYLIDHILYSDIFGESETPLMSNIFKHQVVESGIIGSWPEVPNLDNPERYKNFSLQSSDLLEEQNFKLPTIPSVEAAELAPVFIKNVSYNNKKNTFTKKKSSFYSEQNMFIFFLLSYIFKPDYLTNKNDNTAILGFDSNKSDKASEKK